MSQKNDIYFFSSRSTFWTGADIDLFHLIYTHIDVLCTCAWERGAGWLVGFFAPVSSVTEYLTHSLTHSLHRLPYFAHFINSITLPFQSNKPQSSYTNWICWMCNSKRAKNVFASQIENIKSIGTQSATNGSSGIEDFEVPSQHTQKQLRRTKMIEKKTESEHSSIVVAKMLLTHST